MIKIHHFNEAYQQYKQHKLSFRLLQDQATVMIGLSENTHSSVSNPLDITQADIDWLLQQDESTQSYDALLGGNVYVCETESDLLEIQGCDLNWAEANGGRWPDVTDIPMSWDVCNYLDEASGDPQWVIFVLCWNNAGGPVYYVPKHLWVQAMITEHIEATNPTSNI